MRVPSFCVRNRGQERCRLARASWKAATVVLLSGLRDSFRMAAFSLSSRPRWATCRRRRRRSRELEDRGSSRHISQMNRPPQHNTLNNPFTISINRATPYTTLQWTQENINYSVVQHNQTVHLPTAGCTYISHARGPGGIAQSIVEYPQ